MSESPADPATPDATPTIDAIIDFWFRDADTGRLDLPQTKRWFMSGEKLDAPIRERFGAWIEAAASGRLDHWQKTPTGTLALILLLDQFPRHVWRRQPQAFAFGEPALARCRAGLAAGQDRLLPLTHRVFFYLPLEHSESMTDQHESLALFARLQDEAPADLAEFVEHTWASAVEHHDIVARFGRYPHRNAVLGRQPTAAETRWLGEGARNFGQ